MKSKSKHPYDVYQSNSHYTVFRGLTLLMNINEVNYKIKYVKKNSKQRRESRFNVRIKTLQLSHFTYLSGIIFYGID